MKFLSKKVTPEFERNDPLDLAGANRTEERHSSSGGFAGEEESFQAEPIAQTAEENEAPSGSGADDALGLYLKQMGSIPLLNKEKERTLAQKLEFVRDRYRRAVLCNWLILRRLGEIFDLVCKGQLNLDPQIDVIASTGLTREHIVARMPHNLKTLRRLLQVSGQELPRLHAHQVGQDPVSPAPRSVSPAAQGRSPCWRSCRRGRNCSIRWSWS